MMIDSLTSHYLHLKQFDDLYFRDKETPPPDHPFSHLYFDANHLDISLLAETFKKYDVVVIRQFFDKEIIKKIARQVAFAYQATDHFKKLGFLKEDFFNVAGHIPQACISPNGDCSITIADLSFHSLLETVKAHLFADPRPTGFAVRRILPPSLDPMTVEWHQDAYFAGENEILYNFWLPLVPCGIDAPSLSVIPQSRAPIFTQKEMEQGRLQQYMVESGLDQAPVFTPVLNVGDTILLHSLVLHATHKTPLMTKPRYSLELRGPIKREEAVYRTHPLV